MEVWEYLPKGFSAHQGPNIHLTMKGVGTPKYHLGADFFRDEDRTLCL